MWDAVVDARVLKRKTSYDRRDLERRGDETRLETFSRFIPRDARLRALSAPRRAARLGKRQIVSACRLLDA
jgi:hypothetical protein